MLLQLVLLKIILLSHSSGLVSQMSRGEIEAVIAHEISHISNGDMITMTLIQGIINTFVIFFSRIIGHFVDRVIFKVQRGMVLAIYTIALSSNFIIYYGKYNSNVVL